MSKEEKRGGDLQRVGKAEGPRGNVRGDGKDKEKDEDGKKSLARMRQEALERDDGNSQLCEREKSLF